MDQQSITNASNPLHKLVERTTSLYRLPTVAQEVLRLSANNQVKALALKECAEQDPGLTARILRVVNSPLFGLSGRVSNLQQAVALLGAKPLRMLVLGFSLPDKLTANLAGKQLQRYWTRNLTRAVAARLLSEKLWQHPGDDAYLAALLQEVGFLVLLQELGPAYARFCERVDQEVRSLDLLERESLGFTHRELSAELLRRWRLPLRVVEAIRLPPQTQRLARLQPTDGELPQILHLADLLTSLVAERKLSALPELLAAGYTYRELTRERLNEIVAQLQPQVDELASAMSLQLKRDRDYCQMLVDAQAQLALVTEDAAAESAAACDETEMCDALLAELTELGQALKRSLESRHRGGVERLHRARPDAPHSLRRRFGSIAVLVPAVAAQLVDQLEQTVANCRARRAAFSLLLFDLDSVQVSSSIVAKELGPRLRQSFERARQTLDFDAATCLPLGITLTAAILPNCERRDAVALAQRLIDIGRREEFVDWPTDKHPPTIHVGVAHVTQIAKNFAVETLLGGAEGCLAAAKSCGTSAVKSIEVF